MLIHSWEADVQTPLIFQHTQEHQYCNAKMYNLYFHYLLLNVFTYLHIDVHLCFLFGVHMHLTSKRAPAQSCEETQTPLGLHQEVSVDTWVCVMQTGLQHELLLFPDYLLLCTSGSFVKPLLMTTTVFMKHRKGEVMHDAQKPLQDEKSLFVHRRVFLCTDYTQEETKNERLILHVDLFLLCMEAISMFPLEV